eukprot:350699-Chlamydomonas_euryale.AAC.18
MGLEHGPACVAMRQLKCVTPMCHSGDAVGGHPATAAAAGATAAAATGDDAHLGDSRMRWRAYVCRPCRRSRNNPRRAAAAGAASGAVSGRGAAAAQRCQRRCQQRRRRVTREQQGPRQPRLRQRQRGGRRLPRERVPSRLRRAGAL